MQAHQGFRVPGVNQHHTIQEVMIKNIYSENTDFIHFGWVFLRSKIVKYISEPVFILSSAIKLLVRKSGFPQFKEI